VAIPQTIGQCLAFFDRILARNSWNHHKANANDDDDDGIYHSIPETIPQFLLGLGQLCENPIVR